MKFSRRCTWHGKGGALVHHDHDAMQTLATFPKVQIGGLPPAADFVSCATPAVIPATNAATPRRAPPVTRRMVPRVPSRSVTMLAIVALATWAAVWWIERGREGDAGAAVMAGAGASSGEAVVR